MPRAWKCGCSRCWRRWSRDAQPTIFVVPTMYTLFARRTVPGANKTVGREEAGDAAVALIHPVMAQELAAK